MKGYIIKAGTIIFLSTIVIWFLMNFGDAGEGFGLLDSRRDYAEYSLMAGLGNLLAWMLRRSASRTGKPPQPPSPASL